MLMNRYNRRLIGAMIKVVAPVKARHRELSLVVSPETGNRTVPARLLELVRTALAEIADISLSNLSDRGEAAGRYLDIWPGEHYRLLAAIIKAISPKLVIEIGTATGLSALAMRQYLPGSGQIVTFDIVPWEQYPGTCLRGDDFSDGRLKQWVDDLSRKEILDKYRGLLRKADVIFIDAEKDGKMEQDFLDNLDSISFVNPPIVIFDDIRLWNMLGIWRKISKAKLDITSFGHWSGTGLIDWRDNGQEN
jgi:predicted O-methyltransferase YrrM